MIVCERGAAGSSGGLVPLAGHLRSPLVRLESWQRAGIGRMSVVRILWSVDDVHAILVFRLMVERDRAMQSPT